jgi:hypothetical protein
MSQCQAICGKEEEEEEERKKYPVCGIFLLAEWSKALVLATSLFGGVGSDLTAGIRL